MNLNLTGPSESRALPSKNGGAQTGLSQEDDGLLLSYVRPHKSVTKDTTAQWIKAMLQRLGVDTTKFTVGGVRSAAVSKAKAMSVPIASIMSKAGWTQESTFAKFHDKHIVPEVSCSSCNTILVLFFTYFEMSNG
ncbi:hypothetical protein E2C01_051331 [Portunus trituberculatus]|uniref:Tyr recombinase domain-containing protein n=1 Tax=Portunus trituberculatus TaxID=210409 RepID=A0A5B7GEG4_PORTR|nr:hypothetical protein [Portunus trituberculatus]